MAVYIRLWFWSRTNPAPKIIDRGKGDTIRGAMHNRFVPVGNRHWVESVDPSTGDVYVRCGEAGYCGQEIVEGEYPRTPTTVPKPRRPKPRLEEQDAVDAERVEERRVKRVRKTLTA